MERILSLLFIVAVLYVNDVKSSGCDGYQKISVPPLTCETKRTIVDRHNQLRADIAMGKVTNQPPAANMIQMTWDDELAEMAQAWANLCSTKHDKTRTVQRFTVGQNLARTWTTADITSEADLAPDFVHQINSWFNEVKKYQRDGTNSGTGHYTQVIWSETYAVGCGYAVYYDPSKGYTKNYVCNYGPSGNMKGREPYVSGYPSCNNYGMYNSNYYSGLCMKEVYYSLGRYC